MKNLIPFFAILFCLIFFSCSSSVKKDETVQKSQASAADTSTTISKTYKSAAGDESGFNMNFTTFVKGGKVFITFNEDKMREFTKSMDFENFDGKPPYELQGLQGKCKNLTIADIGQDVNPVIAMVLDNGSVQILDVFNAIHYSDLMCSPCLPDLKNISSVKGGEGDGYMTIYAYDSAGNKSEVTEYADLGSFSEIDLNAPNGAHIALRLSPDWKITCKSESSGHIEIYKGCFMGADYLEDQKPQTYSYTLFSQTTDGKLKKINMKGSFTLQKSNDAPDNSFIMPVSGLTFGCKKGDKISFTSE
jgi:uncharacterized spore protein YtfJ